ncbi:MAG TPA: acyltransferase [Allosphingosinicella sp.]|jgi:peptidoglycan/LPS O-acetylase OafA/YrhL
MKRELLHNVQVARFLAAAMVLVTHTADLVYPGSPLFAAFPWGLGVDMFFVISGFIMAYLARGCFGEKGTGRHFLVRRLARIAPPYWFFTTLMLAAAILFTGAVRHTTLSPGSIVSSYFFLPWPRGDGKLNPLLSQGWTLNYEAFFYVAFAAALLFRRGLVWLAAAFVLLVACHPWIPRAWFMLRFWSQPIILEFLAGIVLAHLHIAGKRLPLAAALLCVAVGLVFAVTRPYLGTLAFARVEHQGLAGLFFCIALILGPEPRRVGAFGRALRAGGDASYALYLSHTFTVNAAVIAWRHFPLCPAWLAMAGAMAAAMLLAWLFYRFVERPVTARLQRLSGARPLRGAETVAP